MMTREEHLQWCKDRAIKEYDYYTGDDKQRNGLTSMMSDLNKHAELASASMRMLCVMQMQMPMSRQQFVTFINGFK
jgi:hypothetical protein